VGIALPAQALTDYGDVTATFKDRTAGTGAAASGGIFFWDRSVGGTRNDFSGTLLPNTTANRFITFCIEVGENVSKGVKYSWTVRDLKDAPQVTPATTMGEQRATDIAKLITIALGGQLANALTASSDIVSAVQIALWEIATDRLAGDYSLATGGFQVTGANATSAAGLKAAEWLTALNGDRLSNNIKAATGLVALTERGVQDQIGQVPLPAAAWLLGSGLLGLFGLARRKKAAAAA
jgi:hypothetical protein